jgi:hypothetical protein
MLRGIEKEKFMIYITEGLHKTKDGMRTRKVHRIQILCREGQLL